MLETLKQYWAEFSVLFKKPRSFFQQALNLACVVFWALMMWKGLMIVTGSESPVVVVLSGSMEPCFYRGDILFLTWKPDPVLAGDVIVFNVDGRDIPIVHRIISVHENSKGEVNVLTKGDNNQVDDRGLYARKQLWLKKNNIMGRAQGFLPYVGMVTIWLNDYPWLKYLLVGSMAFMVMIGRE
uniref:Signal peptidase complex catalytic subunit SEC11 n=1 Tax=Chromera velia CCMP2878 TaxID=1169474 RepID=A0A0G4H6A8_9ALVE|mmetsp:Transcript_33762/g.66832  ORF Transcript_33762/g.66832 Transcript_33762/m.66832 type:complete len:183 (+) Transcript_33762:137-685(+)|eukprot:Cvel_24854.t1-p1 / transcript=Cvel_24854.t1 / gene=Cvel_24854 / organism=Chromera_velia_CCMP2878 / gene_product=Signal peptidase complex catalytic subunit SEC11C, putative / transcript_product=Signal peptidase complex catalytic subunit SEC11C, putative / location=Cvel_scaffold2743:19228-22157(+) / protein_length=182 / sequence_SO=supercontig / SO=protein_coding / is_pseudo=false